MLPPSPKDIPQLFQQARTLQGKAAFDEAVAIYNRILAAKPDLAEVHFNLAQIAAARGRAAEALGALKTAAQLKPAEPAIWAAWIDLASKARDTKALKDIARRLPKSGVPAAALAQLQARLNPPVSETERKLKAAIKTSKSSATAHRHYGEFLVAEGRAAEALPFLKTAAKLAPQSGAVRVAMGQAHLRMGAYEAARGAFEKAVSLGVQTQAVFEGLGRVALAQKDDAAVGFFERALGAGSASADLHMGAAAAFRAARLDDKAFASYDAALALSPGHPRILSEKAALLQNVGRADEARAAIAQALETEPENGSLYMLYASASKIVADDPVMARAVALRNGGARDRALSFAVAKAEEARGGAPFPLWVEANALARQAFPYDFEKDAQAAREVRQAFEARDVDAWAAAADPDPRPIFVTGLPRSGTTLIEQIIAAHSQVASAGEVGILGRYVQDVSRVPDTGMIRARYWETLKARFPGADRITDKSIATYVKLGFIKEIMPNARIVVVTRDPRDTAVSIFKNMFAGGQHRYSNDLADIARFMRLFEEQVAFWQDTVPDAFTTIRYDDIIAAPEAQSRQLIKDVGLDWEDACLSFYDSGARVDTLSNVQVRQPIYASSVGAWRKYEDELAPFLETYGPIRM